MSDKQRIVLGEEDFAESSPPETTLPPVGPRRPTSVGLPPAPGAGAPTLGASTLGAPALTSDWLRGPARALLVASGIGVVLAWAVTQAFGIADIKYTSAAGAHAVTGLWTGVVGVMFGGSLLAFDSAVDGAWEVAARRFGAAAAPMFGAAFLAGYLGDVIYHEIVRGVVEDAFRGGGFTENDARLYLARALGWGLFGAGIGGTIGLLRRSREQAINGALGGLLGGAAGGALFQFVGVNLSAGVSMSRLVGLIGIGALIAFATRVIETARREAWLCVLAGGMAGKEFILYHSLTRLGSAPDCEIFLLKDPAIAKLHAQVEDRGAQRILTALTQAPVLVNGAPVSSTVLRDGDRVQLGSTVLGYSERAIAASPGGSVTSTHHEQTEERWT